METVKTEVPNNDQEILLLRGQIKKIGFQWHLIDNKKIIN